MRNVILLAISTMVLIFASCGKENNSVAPAQQAVEATNTVTPDAATSRAATPTVTTVTGTLGYSANTNNSYPTHLRSELEGTSTLTIAGTNMGSTQGASTVYFEKSIGNNQWAATSSYTIPSITWATSGKSISLKLKSSLGSEPIPTARFRVVINNVSYNSQSFAVVPFIDGRQYQQCTWHVSKRTRESGLTASNALYANVNSTINADYVPTGQDILSWGTNVHQAFIESVATTLGTTANGNISTYVLTITEANVPWSGNNNSTAPQTYVTTIKVKKTNGKNAFVSGFGSYRSTKTTSATLYKAQ